MRTSMGMNRVLNSRLKMMVIVWLGIYPTVLGALLALRPFTSNMHIAVEVLLLTIVVVPVAFLVVIPALQRALAPWIRSGEGR
jgi:antibiotic biosynthesis monooxygenase (ABM) superfamily enzyme